MTIYKTYIYDGLIIGLAVALVFIPPVYFILLSIALGILGFLSEHSRKTESPPPYRRFVRFVALGILATGLGVSLLLKP